MKKIIFLAFILFEIFACSETTGPQAEPKISFSPQNVTMVNGAATEISLEISGLSTEIFALSFQIKYDAAILSFNENSGFTAGDFFEQNEISLIKVNGDKIHVSLSLTRSIQSLKGSGNLGTFIFSGISVGNSSIELDESELVFYDTSGNPIEIADLSTIPASMQVN